MNTATKADTVTNTTLNVQGETIRIREGAVHFDGMEIATVRKVVSHDHEMIGSLRTGRFTTYTKWVVTDEMGTEYHGTTLRDAVARLFTAMMED